MAGQYTTTQQLLPSNMMADVMPSKTDINTKNIDKEAFSKELNKASKNYTDKSEVENKADKHSDYSKETKNIHDNKENAVKETIKEIKPEDNSLKTEAKETKGNEKTNTESQNYTSTDNKVVEDISKDNIVEDCQILETQKSVEELIEEIKVNATTVIEEAVEIATTVTNTENTLQTSNKIATEPLIANVEFEESNQQKVLNIQEKIKNTIQSNVIETSEKVAKQTITNTAIDNTTNVVGNNIEQILNVKNNMLQENTPLTNINKSEVENLKDNLKVEVPQNIEVKPTETNVNKENLNTKKTKEIVVSDVTRLTINIEDKLQTNTNLSEEIQNTKTIAPADIIENSTPRIQVTEEVAAQVKDSLGTGIENKDNVSKIKDKAVETMTKLQDKNTVLTESQTYDSNNSNNTNFGQNNANETVAKLSVETNNFNTTQQQTTESFINRLETHIASRETISSQNQIINQNDILSQVNAKFEQLQQQANNKVSIILQPESLGKVSVEIMNTKDGIIAKMTTDTQQVKELFDKNIESLKSNLSAQGVNVNNIKVECAHESTNNAMNFEREQFNQSFNNQQNGHNTNKSEQNSQSTYGADFGTTSDETTEEQEPQTLKNTETIIKHNGKVDYSV